LIAAAEGGAWEMKEVLLVSGMNEGMAEGRNGVRRILPR
jgi:hypothetical protein